MAPGADLRIGLTTYVRSRSLRARTVEFAPIQGLEAGSVAQGHHVVGPAGPARLAYVARGGAGGASREIPGLRIHERRPGLRREGRQGHQGPRQGQWVRGPIERRRRFVHRGRPRALPGGRLPRYEWQSTERCPRKPPSRGISATAAGSSASARRSRPSPDGSSSATSSGPAPRASSPRRRSRTRSPTAAMTRARTCPSTGISTTRITTGPPTSAA